MSFNTQPPYYSEQTPAKGSFDKEVIRILIDPQGQYAEY